MRPLAGWSALAAGSIEGPQAARRQRAQTERQRERSPRNRFRQHLRTVPRPDRRSKRSFRSRRGPPPRPSRHLSASAKRLAWFSHRGSRLPPRRLPRRFPDGHRHLRLSPPCDDGGIRRRRDLHRRGQADRRRRQPHGRGRLPPGRGAGRPVRTADDRVTGAGAGDRLGGTTPSSPTGGRKQAALDPVRVPIWQRGKESAEIVTPAPRRLAVLGLGGTVATSPGGLTAEVVAVSSFDELFRLGASVAREDRPFSTTPFPASDNAAAGYGKIDPLPNRRGATRAAAFGAVAALVRSLASASSGAPHTGQMHYGRGPGPQIPTAALSVEDAALLGRLAARGSVTVHLVLEDGARPDAASFNVVAELRGRLQPEEIVRHRRSHRFVGRRRRGAGRRRRRRDRHGSRWRRCGASASVPRRTNTRGALHLRRGRRPGRQDLRRSAREAISPTTSPPSRPTSAPARRSASDRRAGPEAVAEAREPSSRCWPRSAPRGDRHGLLGRRHQRPAPGRRAAPGPLLRPDVLLRRAPPGQADTLEKIDPRGRGPQRRGDGDDGLRAGRSPWPRWAVSPPPPPEHKPSTPLRRPRPPPPRRQWNARAASRLVALDRMRGVASWC